MKIPLFKINWNDDDIEAVSSVLRSGMNWAAGPKVLIFEKMIADYLGIKHVLVFNSGTGALHLALIALGIGKGSATAGRDEVIVPSFSFIATANVPIIVGAKPVFADIETDTYGLDVADVRNKITDKTKAIISMHYGGLVARDIEKLKELTKEKGIYLIEDAAESFGAKLNGQFTGTFGDLSMFSFCQTKVFTTGEGGCIVTDSDELYDKINVLRSHGRRESDKKYISYGYNFRMADFIAALGISQIARVDQLISLRREKAKYLTSLLDGVGDIIIPQVPANMFSVYQEFHLRTSQRDKLKQYLEDNGIGTRISFPPIHLSHYYKEVLGYDVSLPNTIKITSETLTLPLYPDLTNSEIEYIARTIKTFYEKE